MKLILGTANLNNSYGVNKNKLSLTEYKKITNLFKNNFYIDTAHEYKNIDFIKKNKNKIFYKLNLIPNSKNLKIIEKISKIKNLHCIMLHNAKNLEHKHFNLIYEKIFKLKKLKIINNFGISIYDLKDLKKIKKKYFFDYIQIPVNILNQTFNEKNTSMLRRRGTKFIARSIFLQGIIFTSKYLKFNNKILNNKILLCENFCKKKKISKSRLFLNYIKTNKWLWGLVIGVDKYYQIKEISNILKKKALNINYKELRIKDEKIIDPRNW